MADSRSQNQKQPGEKERGKFHYNPGNMSEKTADGGSDKSKQQANADNTPRRQKGPNQDRDS